MESYFNNLKGEATKRQIDLLISWGCEIPTELSKQKASDIITFEINRQNAQRTQSEIEILNEKLFNNNEVKMSRFDYVKYDEIAQQQQSIMKDLFSALDMCINQLDTKNHGATIRAKSLAITKLEECYMWVGKLILDDQNARLKREDQLSQMHNNN